MKRENLEIVTIGNVKGYVDNSGNAWLNAEDVARGWGFVQNKNHIEYVRWETLNGYLNGFGYSQQVGKDDYLPENIVYRLGFKASNETVQAFQLKLSDVILPSIRKHGGYLTPAKVEEVLLNPDTIIKLATDLKEARAKVEEMKPKALFADAVSTSDTSILVGELAKLIKQNGVDMGEKRLFEWMRGNGYLIGRRGTDWNMPTQKSMELGVLEIKERTINNPDGSVRITRTTKVTGKGQVYFVNKFSGGKERICG